jgi:hypothetical protein
MGEEPFKQEYISSRIQQEIDGDVKGESSLQPEEAFKPIW